MKKHINTNWIILFLLSVLMITSCSSMDEYKDFIKGGEISYTGKIDSVVIYSGDGRVYITGLFNSDPKVTNCRIYWNSMKDSLDVPVNKTEGIDSLKQFISLPENLYNFQIHTFDALGNKSVAVYAIGQSYGEAYKASINNRLIIFALADDNDNVTINWRNIDKTLGAFATNLVYTNNSNTEKTVKVGIDEMETVLSDYKKGSLFSYFTLFSPDTLCIDTFKSATETHSTSYKIDKKNWIASADTYEETGQLPNGGPPSFVIDDNPETYWHTAHTTHTTPFPHWLAFDMGKVVIVDMVELTSRHDYLGADFKNFIIEGRLSENDEWTAYGSYFLSDIAGPQPFLISDSPKMRYIRIYQIDGGSEPHSHLAEFSVYGNYEK